MYGVAEYRVEMNEWYEQECPHSDITVVDYRLEDVISAGIKSLGISGISVSKVDSNGWVE